MADLNTVRRRQSRGQALAEFAIAAPIMLLVVFAIFDLGRAVYAFNTISEAARSGSRVAIVNQNLAAIQVATFKFAVALDIASDDIDVCYLPYDDVSDACVTPAIGDVASVTVHYEFNAVTPIISSLVGTIDMTSTTRLPVERIFSSPGP